MPDYEARSDLKAHLRECALQNQMIWKELHALRKVMGWAVAGIISTLAVVCGALLKAALHL